MNSEKYYSLLIVHYSFFLLLLFRIFTKRKTSLNKLIMEIKVLGTGCTKCKKLYELVCKSVEENKVEANIEKEEDITKIMGYGVMSTPALVIDGKVVLSGKLPSAKDLEKLLK